MIYKDTLFLRAVAIVLILNSHLDAYYHLKHLGTGGAFGNTLFFMLSAFGLTASFQKRRKKTFFAWYSQRLMKIFPSVWLTLLFIALPIELFFNAAPMDINQYIFGLLFPPYWFLQALLLFYALGYLLLKNPDKRYIFVSMGILYLIYFFFYFNYLDLTRWSVENLPFKLINYMVIFVWGIFLGTRTDKIRYSGLKDLIILFCLIAGIYGHKILMFIGMLSEYQFVQQILLLPFGFYCLKVARSKWITDYLMQHPILTPPIALLGSMTLEIYIVHVTLTGTVLRFDIPFPGNALIFLLSTLFFSYLIKKGTAQRFFQKNFFG